MKQSTLSFSSRAIRHDRYHTHRSRIASGFLLGCGTIGILLIVFAVSSFIGHPIIHRATKAAVNQFFASPNGSGPTCSASVPCSLTQAIALGQVMGGEVIAKDGTYPQYVPAATSNGYSAYTINQGTLPLTIRAEHPLRALLDFSNGSVGSYGSIAFSISNRSNVSIQGFSIEGQYLNSSLDVRGGSNIAVSGMLVRNVGTKMTGGETTKTDGVKRCPEGGAFHVSYETEGPVYITDNTAYNLGPMQTEPNGATYPACNLIHGIYDSGRNTHVSNNIFSNLGGGACMHIYVSGTSATKAPSDSVYTNNICDHAGSGIVIGDDSGLIPGKGFVVAKNSIRDVKYCLRHYSPGYDITWNNNNCYAVSETPLLYGSDIPAGTDAIRFASTTYVDPGYLYYPLVPSPASADANYFLAANSALYGSGVGLIPTSPSPTPTATTTPQPTVTASPSPSVTPSPTMTTQPTTTPTTPQTGTVRVTLPSSIPRISNRPYDVYTRSVTLTISITGSLTGVIATINGSTTALSGGKLTLPSANGDYKVIIKDNTRTYFSQTIRIRHPDYNRSGKVDTVDLNLLSSRIGRPYRAAYTIYDLNLDGKLDGTDTAKLQQAWGK